MGKLRVVLAAWGVAVMVAACGEGPEAGRDWDYTLTAGDRGAVLETEAFSVIFEGQNVKAPLEGKLRVAGPGEQRSEISVGDQTLRYDYANGQANLAFAGQRVAILNEGNALRIGDLTYQLKDKKTRIVLRANGQTEIIPD